MRWKLPVWMGCLAVLLPAAGLAQPDPLQGRWEGIFKFQQGERKATVSFKKEGAAYSGNIGGIGGTTEIPFKEIKLEGEKGNALVQFDSPQGPIAVKFDFILKGESLEGKGEFMLGTQQINFTYDLKRTGDLVAKAELSPEQKLNYFVGEWKFDMIGRDSPLGSGGNMEGTMTFQKILDGKFLESRHVGKADTVAFRGGGYIGFDSTNKIYAFFEYHSNGVVIFSTGTWVGPGIRLQAAPIHIKGETIQLKRAISIVSENTFTFKDEFSLNGGPFQRLANGMFTKVVPAAEGKQN